MSGKYPRVGKAMRAPKKEKDGIKNYGLPCIVCGKNTLGKRAIQISTMRGDDDVVRVCADHYHKSTKIIEAYRGKNAS